MPAHWQPQGFNDKFSILSATLSCISKVLCLLAVGHASLDRLWDSCSPEASRDEWNEYKAEVQRRYESIAITAGLLLATVAAFLTTVPPSLELLRYTDSGAYMSLYLGFGMDYGTLLVGSSILLVLAKSERDWFRETMMGSRSCVLCTLIIMAYPIVAIAFAAEICAFGIVINAVETATQAPLSIAGAPMVFCTPFLIIPAFGWTQFSYFMLRRRKPGQSKDTGDAVECDAV